MRRQHGRTVNTSASGGIWPVRLSGHKPADRPWHQLAASGIARRRWPRSVRTSSPAD